MKLYYLFKKSYSKLLDGFEYQLADGGEKPEIFTNRKKAEHSFDYSVKFYSCSFGYDLIIPSEINPAAKGDCLKAARLYDKKCDIRLEIRLYQIWTIK